MSQGSKTNIPFQSSQVAGGNGLPAAAEAVILFNSVVTFGKKSLQMMSDHYWFTYSIAPNANATGNSVTAQYSNDGGVTWNEFYASASNKPVGDGTTFNDEIFIGPYQDIRVKYNNGAAAQTAFAVNMSLDSFERNSKV
jgi:hypothetical protein